MDKSIIKPKISILFEEVIGSTRILLIKVPKDKIEMNNNNVRKIILIGYSKFGS